MASGGNQVASPNQSPASPTSDSVTYLVEQTSSPETGYLGTVTLPCAQAAHVNLPGPYTYDPYIPPPTDAIEASPFGTIGPANPAVMCSLADAQLVVQGIASLYPGMTLAIVQQNSGIFHFVYNRTPNRAWIITVANSSGVVEKQFPAAQLVAAMYSHGKGFPMAWSLLNGVPNCTPGTPPATCAPGFVPMPLRPLLPNEVIVAIPDDSLFNPQGAVFVVQRTDLMQQASPQPVEAQLAAAQTQIGQLAAFIESLEAELAG